MCVKGALVVVTVLSVTRGVIGNGYMVDPPARASMWRMGYKTPIDYNDMNINCGGFYIQHVQNGGLCGLCGDRYDGIRHYETGGKYANGTITNTYKAGGIIPIRVNLTSTHGGWFEFRLCEFNDVTKTETRECFEMNLLKLKDDGETRFKDVPYGGLTNPVSVLMQYQLPSGVLCRHCILQWIYNTGKDWRCDEEGVCALGLGAQEQFVGCSDIGISRDGNPWPPLSTGSDQTTSKGVSSGQSSTVRGGDSTKTTGTNGDQSTKKPGGNVGGGTTTTSTQVPTTTIRIELSACRGIGVLEGAYDQFCRDMCYTDSKCSTVFCNEMCHLRAKQLDNCNEKGVCPIDG